jgi:hypothetical protein
MPTNNDGITAERKLWTTWRCCPSKLEQCGADMIISPARILLPSAEIRPQCCVNSLAAPRGVAEDAHAVVEVAL